MCFRLEVLQGWYGGTAMYGGGGGRSECRSAEWNVGAVVLVGGKRYSKWLQIGSYKKKQIITVGIRNTKMGTFIK